MTLQEYRKKGFKGSLIPVHINKCRDNTHYWDWSSDFGRKENEINFGSSGCFTPDVKESYGRTVHAASLLKNWAFASDIVNTHCKMYADLEKECFEQKVSS